MSVPVLLHMLALLPSLEHGLVMVQSEVADRLAAPPGSKVYGVPSVKAAWYADVRRAGAIGRNVFWPAPNVDSGLVAWTRREPPETTATREQVFAVVDAAFAHRRKTLRSTLKGMAGSAEAAEAALAHAGIDPMARGEAIGVADFARIAEGLHLEHRCSPSLRSPSAPRRRSTCTWASARSAPTASTPLATAYQAVSLFSTVTATPGRAHWSVSCDGGAGVDVSGVPLDDTNLALRAARLLAGTRPGSTSRSRCTSTRASRSPADWPAGRPTPPRRCWPATACGSSATPRDELLALAGRAGLRRAVRAASAAPPPATAGASWSRRCRTTAPGPGWC